MAERKQKRMSAQVVEDEDYQLRYEVVAGLDLAKDSAVVCVRMPPAEGKKQRRSQLHQSGDRPGDHGAGRAAEGAGRPGGVDGSYLRLLARVVRGPGGGRASGAAGELLPGQEPAGRPKTDKEDARWIARLTEMGMLRPSFVPPPEIRALRVCTRLLFDLTADRTRCWQRLEKLLEDALCKLSSAVSKLAGPRDRPGGRRGHDRRRARPAGTGGPGPGQMSIQRVDALEDSLAGMQFGPQHAHAAASLLRQVDLLEQEIRDAEDAVTAHLAAIPRAWGVDAGGATGPEACEAPGAAVLPAADRLDEIPGMGRQSAAALIAEIGLDMSRFPTPEALVSWACATPTAKQSGPRKGRGKKGHGNTYAKRVCVLAACAAANTDTFLGERFRRPRPPGPAEAGARKPPAPWAGPSS